jgi:hypothetical protein
MRQSNLTSFLARFSSGVSSGSLGAATASGISVALGVAFFAFGLAALAVESFADLGVDAPFVALGVLVNLMLMVVFGFLIESAFGESCV